MARKNIPPAVEPDMQRRRNEPAEEPDENLSLKWWWLGYSFLYLI